MILGIDASNIRSGGGVTHLVELLRAADPASAGFERVLVWANAGVLNKLEDRVWLKKIHIRHLERALPIRLWWQYRQLGKCARATACDILFVPGGSAAGDFKPLVTMSRNMLPFEWREMRRYGFSWMTLRNFLLRYAQMRSFRKASSVIFLTEYAKSRVEKTMSFTRQAWPIIAHGVDPRFLIPPRQTRVISECNRMRPFRILYVSIIDVYKHQWQVVEAVAALRLLGYPVTLDLIGPPGRYAIGRLKEAIRKFDPKGEFVHYHGAVSHESLHKYYRTADINVYASSCENLPNILLEGMAGGLPIACSDLGPMPEILGKAGVYFNPEDSNSIASSLAHLIDSPNLRSELAQAAFEKAKQYSWQLCATRTFDYLASVAWYREPK